MEATIPLKKSLRRKTKVRSKNPAQLEFDFDAAMNYVKPKEFIQPFRIYKEIPNQSGWRPTEPEQT